MDIFSLIALGKASGSSKPLQFKSVVETTSALPSSGNKVGDLYYVKEDSSEYVWVNVDNVQRWESLGPTIDMSNYALTPYVIHAVDGVVTEAPADIAAAFADTSRRVVLDVDGFVYDRYLYIGEMSAGDPDAYEFYQITLEGAGSTMEVRGLYLSPSTVTITERLHLTLMAVGDNISDLVNDAGYIVSPSSPPTGAFIMWDGTAWVAQTLATWQGGNY